MIKFGLYIHWPFCLAKCPYCDFNSHVRQSIDDGAWQRALLAELRYWREQTPNHQLHTVFFGGGTPSLMTPATVAALIDSATRLWPSGNNVEITLEANPTSVEADKFAGFKAAGVNRVSLGVQALHDEALQFLGRQHNVAEAKAALQTAARYFSRYSFDLIYARPAQTLPEWQAELAEALHYAADHLSLYQLTIEENTGFKALYDRGRIAMPDEHTAATLYETTEELMAKHGMPAYEISNHARPDAACRHNLIYWQYDDYIGIGPGAHGRVQIAGQRYATTTEKMPERWLKLVSEKGHALVEQTAIDYKTAAAEALMMGLRLTDGVSRRGWYEKFGTDVLDFLSPAGLATLLDTGFISVSENSLQATAAGRQRLNAVLDKLLHAVS